MRAAGPNVLSCAMMHLGSRFETATSDKITIILKSGNIKTITRQTIHSTSVKKPILRRTNAWIFSGLTSVGVLVFVYTWPDFELLGGDIYPDAFARETGRGLAIISLPVWLVSSMTMHYQPIYEDK